MSDPSPYTDSELLKQIAGGNENAFRQLFHEHWQNVYGVAFMLTKSAPMAEDMVQDVFLKIWVKREQLPRIEKLRAYLFIVARNHILSELRRHSQNQSFSRELLDYFEDQRHNPEQELLHKESGRLIRDAVGRLPPQQAAVYRMSREQHLSHAEIAENLDISKNTVRNHIAQALKNIRRLLESQIDGMLLYICLIEIWLK